MMKKYSNGITMSAFGAGFDFTVSIFKNGHFLNEMSLYELNWLLPNLYYCNKTVLENTRFISYIIAQTQSTKPLKITDIMQFEWEKESTNNNTKVTAAERERLKNKLKNRLQKINGE